MTRATLTIATSLLSLLSLTSLKNNVIPRSVATWGSAAVYERLPRLVPSLAMTLALSPLPRNDGTAKCPSPRRPNKVTKSQSHTVTGGGGSVTKCDKW